MCKFWGKKEDSIPGRAFYERSKYVSKSYEKDLKILEQEILAVDPNVILALGNLASWAIFNTGEFEKTRGAISETLFKPKGLSTYHPKDVTKNWQLHPIFVADCMKAKEESKFRAIRYPEREIWIEPTLEDLYLFYEKHIKPNPRLSIDIETVAGDIVTCIGFAPTPEHALVVPFFDDRKPGHNYWSTLDQELDAWDFVRDMCESNKEILFQNGMYDMNVMSKTYGIFFPHATHDTMLLHHALQPEMKKGLAFMGTLYTNQNRWKTRRHNATLKRED